MTTSVTRYLSDMIVTGTTLWILVSCYLAETIDSILVPTTEMSLLTTANVEGTYSRPSEDTVFTRAPSTSVQNSYSKAITPDGEDFGSTTARLDNAAQTTTHTTLLPHGVGSTSQTEDVPTEKMPLDSNTASGATSMTTRSQATAQKVHTLSTKQDSIKAVSITHSGQWHSVQTTPATTYKMSNPSPDGISTRTFPHGISTASHIYASTVTTGSSNSRAVTMSPTSDGKVQSIPTWIQVMIAGIGGGLVLLLIAILICCIYRHKKRKSHKMSVRSNNDFMLTSANQNYHKRSRDNSLGNILPELEPLDIMPIHSITNENIFDIDQKKQRNGSRKGSSKRKDKESSLKVKLTDDNVFDSDSTVKPLDAPMRSFKPIEYNESIKRSRNKYSRSTNFEEL